MQLLEFVCATDLFFRSKKKPGHAEYLRLPQGQGWPPTHLYQLHKTDLLWEALTSLSLALNWECASGRGSRCSAWRYNQQGPGSKLLSNESQRTGRDKWVYFSPPPWVCKEFTPDRALTQGHYWRCLQGWGPIMFPCEAVANSAITILYFVFSPLLIFLFPHTCLFLELSFFLQ